MTSVRHARAAAQLLAGEASRPAREVVSRLLALQAQDGRAADQALRARGAAASAPGDEVVLAWLVRGTLHLTCAEDWPWLHGLTAPTPAAHWRGAAR